MVPPPIRLFRYEVLHGSSFMPPTSAFLDPQVAQHCCLPHLLMTSQGTIANFNAHAYPAGDRLRGIAAAWLTRIEVV